MLLTDTPAIEIEDLADHETSILDTASTEGINLTVKIGLARDEVGLQMQSRFPQLGLVNIGLMNVAITPAQSNDSNTPRLRCLLSHFVILFITLYNTISVSLFQRIWISLFAS